MSHSSENKHLVAQRGKAGKIETPLDKAKREFARLLDSVEKLKKETEARETNLQEIRRRIQNEINPMVQEVIKMRLALNTLLEEKIAEKGFSRRDKNTLIDLLFYNCDLLEQNFGQDMTEVKRRHMTKSELKQMSEMESVQDLFNEFFQEAQKQFFDQTQGNGTDENAQADGRQKKNNRKRKTATHDMPQPEPIDPAVKKKLDLQRYIRSLYLSLVKNIHPDLELDSEKKQQRTDLMQKVTHAYQHLDLYELLKAKKELIEIEDESAAAGDSGHEIEEMEQLKQYIKILKSQQQEIQSEQFTQSLFSPDAALLNKFYHPLQAGSLDKAFKKEVNLIKQEIKKMQAVEKVLADSESTKAYLEKVRPLRSLKTVF